MTVYSKQRNQNQKTHERTSAVSSPWIFKLNALLFILGIFVIGGYVVMANRVTSDRFTAGQMQREYQAISSVVASEVARLDHGQDIDKLIAFVRKSGMIQNANGQTLLITSNVAFLP